LFSGFRVRPPKKSWKNIINLSGGEKTLSSLALVFALHYYRPTPFYVMDEIDAALDFKNVSIVGRYIKVTSKKFLPSPVLTFDPELQM
jgi:structural maintenance of chromosome 4